VRGSKNSRSTLCVAAIGCCLFLCGPARTQSLKQAIGTAPVVGVALNVPEILGHDASSDAIVQEQFNSISPENVLKWQSIHPAPDHYAFSLADRYVEFGEKHHMFVVGHTLVWHSQVPAWVFRDSKGNLVDRDTLLKRMHDHIATVVGRYRGRVQSWDVVNEVLNDDGTLRQSLWLKIIGEDYIAKAFQYAHEADPEAQLVYNDYSLENKAKLQGALALVKKLKLQGVPITGVGMQCHVSLANPSIQAEEETIEAFAKLGVKVAISELDVDVLPRASKSDGADVSIQVQQDAALNPYTAGLPETVEEQLATRYADLFRVYLQHRDVVNRITLWGVTDADSWLNNWPVRGRTSYPLLFDSEGRPKPAFYSVLKVAEKATSAGN